jgi:hypothetical protein
MNDCILTKPGYRVFSNRVEDDGYGVTASTPDGVSLFSPHIPRCTTREITTKFDALHPGDWWRPQPEALRFPLLETRHPIVNAVYKLALDIFHRCSSGEFLRHPENGETAGMWQAGFATGDGYGVWVRDVAYIGLYMGNLFDPEGAARSLRHVAAGGIDSNAEDSRALPAIALWDYYCATGDQEMLACCYPDLKQRLNQIKLIPERGIAKAKHASFIDGDGQEENGGFALSTNILYAEAHRIMALMGALCGENVATLRAWRERAETLRTGINREYWNDAFGYYANGPRGSEGYEKGFWENGGQSLAIWPRFGIADDVRRASVLDHSGHAFNQYGFAECPHWLPKDFPRDPMFARKIWLQTQVGEAVAMARLGRGADLETLLLAAVRDAAVNKTFMETICFDTGSGGRYPGQNWHGMAFVAMIYLAMLGLKYDEQGLWFADGFVPPSFADLRIMNLRYRRARYDIAVQGDGRVREFRLDGKAATKIPVELCGDHRIELVCTAG